MSAPRHLRCPRAHERLSDLPAIASCLLASDAVGGGRRKRRRHPGRAPAPGSLTRALRSPSSVADLRPEVQHLRRPLVHTQRRSRLAQPRMPNHGGARSDRDDTTHHRAPVARTSASHSRHSRDRRRRAIGAAAADVLTFTSATSIRSRRRTPASVLLLQVVRLQEVARDRAPFCSGQIVGRQSCTHSLCRRARDWMQSGLRKDARSGDAELRMIGSRGERSLQP